jgi:DNA polymerase III subunit gamma/tau
VAPSPTLVETRSPSVSAEPASSATEAAGSDPPLAPPTSTGAEAVPGAGGDDAPFPTRDQLVQAWGDHVIAGLRPKAKALFQAGRFVGVDGEEARFGLPNETHRVRCEELRSEVESALSQYFGRRIRLGLVVDDAPSSGEDSPRPPSPPTPPTPRRTPDRSAAPTRSEAPPEEPDPVGSDDADDLSVFDDEPGEVADIDNSVTSRVLQAFPGAEEVG